MAGETCDVCGRPSSGVASSSLGAVSFAYCHDCAHSGAEPYGFLVYMVADIGGLRDCADWMERTIQTSLAAVGKTWERFEEDVARAVEEMRAFESAAGSEP